VTRLTAMGALVGAILVAGCGFLPRGVIPSPTATPPPRPEPVVSPAATATPSSVPFTIVAFPDPISDPLDAAVADRLRQALEDAVATRGGNAITAVVLIGDRGMWTGTASRPGATAPAPDEPWTTGSIGKTITAAEVMRLAERGRVELDAPAASLFQPGVDLDTNGATVRDLLQMRSGLTHHDPHSTVWEYTNRDYELLGRVIEGVEGKPLADVLVGDVLAIPDVTDIRVPEDGTVANAAGPLDADPISLARWGYALFGGDVVAEDRLRQMVTFDENTYGMGVFDFSKDFGVAAAGHLGIDEPDSAAMVAFPNDAMVIVTMGKGATWEQSYGALQDLRAAL